MQKTFLLSRQRNVPKINVFATRRKLVTVATITKLESDKKVIKKTHLLSAVPEGVNKDLIVFDGDWTNSAVQFKSTLKHCHEATQKLLTSHQSKCS